MPHRWAFACSRRRASPRITPPPAHGKSAQAIAHLKNAQGKDVGTVVFTRIAEGVKINVTAMGLPPGKHGIHIHEHGKCEGPDFKSSGGHYTLKGMSHGLSNPKGPHNGDLPNLLVRKDGTAKAQFISKRVEIKEGEAPLLREGGTAVVIHADADDQKSNPAGNAGARIACGVIQAM